MSVHHVPRQKGSQYAWDMSYNNSFPMTYGLHNFNVGNEVRHVDGRVGEIVNRTALTAIVEWRRNGRATIDQFDETILVTRSRTR